MDIFIVFNIAIISLGLFILGFNCTSLGLISPIEVVEEWGCYDSEIRLTCSHLDSKIAILEATFTPNCTQEGCLRVDYKRLARANLPPKKTDPRLAETEAGRKFLETLRKPHPNEDETDDEPEGEDEKLREYDYRSKNTGDPRADHLISRKGKRTSLRASLERLIVKYLRKLSPNEDYGLSVKRSARSRRESLPIYTEGSERVVIGERNITIDDVALQDEDNKERYKKFQGAKSICLKQRRNITSLNRFDIDKALKNESDVEHNIRRVLNRRCSGKNHCSFLFAVDHPFSVLWESGTVRVKYICMEDFRINRYCGEHLTIGNEVTPRVRHVRPQKGEPVAEARVQTLHSLKILKTGEEIQPSTESRRRRPKIQNQEQKEESRQTSQSVYSQDFRLLKILPSNLEDFNDIEKIGDEIYFRTEDENLGLILPTISTSPVSRRTSSTHSVALPTTSTRNKYSEVEIPLISDTESEIETDETLFPNTNRNISKYENITLIIREGEEYIITFPKPRVFDNISVNTTTTTTSSITPAPYQPPTIFVTNMTENIFPSSSVTPVKSSFLDKWEDVVLKENPNILDATKDDEELRREQDFGHRNTTRLYELIENEIEVMPTDDLSALATEDLDSQFREDNRFVIDKTEEIYDDNEDDSDEDFFDDRSDRRSYKSMQRTSFRKPLLQGFFFTPGYPKFYIGDSECKWTVVAPIGQKIRLTILDISLRYEATCKDFVTIVDMGVGRNLFNSCTESVKPQDVISHSNQIEVMVKTTTNFAYPKRGVLFHYSGCLTPPPPINGRLVKRTETTAVFECDADFFFPDTAVSVRELICTEQQHTWNTQLPDCIEKLAVAGAGFVSSFNIGYPKKPEMTSKSNPGSDKDADMVYDIIIPTTIIAGLFVVNAIIFIIIMRFRNRSRNANLETDGKELAEL